MHHVIFVDDEVAIREAVRTLLERSGYTVTLCANAQACRNAVGDDFPGIVITDLRMAGMDGMQLLEHLIAHDHDLPVLLITAHGDIAQAVQAMHLGAYDFIEKPFSPDRLLESVRRACEKRDLARENRRLRDQVAHQHHLDQRLIGLSPGIKRLRQQVLELAATPANVLLRGETGSGKEQVARCLHDFSPRADAPFVALNCAAIPEHLFESEVFGHETGAFTGAQARRVGRIEYANGGTLFLDEIESMPFNQQAKLLRVIQEQQVERLGSNQPVPLDVRYISATKPDLREEARGGRFREDLLYRLNVAELTLPPLRTRREDIMLLFSHYAERAAARLGRAAAKPRISEIAWLLAHDWPGNVRELINAAERYVLGLSLRGLDEDAVKDEPSLAEMIEAFEAQCLREALLQNEGNLKAVMATLKVPRRTLYEKLQRHGVVRQGVTTEPDTGD